MQIDQKYFQRIAHELDKNLTQVGIQHGTASPIYQLVQDLRAVVLTIVDDIVHPLVNKKSDGINTEKAMETGHPHESISSPYNDLAHCVFEYKKAALEYREIVSKRDNMSIKVDSALNRKGSAKKAMDAAFEKLYR